ncbi:MAG: hypothetical protein HY692_03990, partial [Cyanobacteria bacterium NC_groundwater_1444_Ag_S-0.65um_54_12]|nr:hypothetical protein [Cyanobacteria bacterium NC_groundwater_1444_Ag_S-0.65um_54_12]
KGLAPKNKLERQVRDIYNSRQTRWKRLALLAGSKTPPRTFNLYRSEAGIPAFDVIRAWSDDSTKTLTIRTQLLSSWTLSRDAGERIANQDIGPKHVPRVLYEAAVPFEQTLLDKWSDGGALATSPYRWQEEVVVAHSHKNALSIPKENATVFLDGIRYSYADRNALFKAMNEHYSHAELAENFKALDRL